MCLTISSGPNRFYDGLEDFRGGEATCFCAGGDNVFERVGDGGGCAGFLFAVFWTFLGGGSSDEELEASSELLVRNTEPELTHLEVESDPSESELESVDVEEEDEEDGEGRFLFRLFPTLSDLAPPVELSDSLDFRLAWQSFEGNLRLIVRI